MSPLVGRKSYKSKAEREKDKMDDSVESKVVEKQILEVLENIRGDNVYNEEMVEAKERLDDLYRQKFDLIGR